MPDFGRFNPNGGDPSLNEINRSDRFLDALASQQPVYATDAGEAELVNVLAGWRDEIREKPLTVPVTPRDAVIALDAAQRSHKSSRRTLALVGSTAAAVLCLGGFVSVVAGAGPGDTLYGLRTMIFGEQQTTRDDAVMLASQQLAEVQQLVDRGQWQAAQDKLETLTTTVATVNDDSQKENLVSQWQQLTVKVEAKDAAATLPPDVPPPTFPQVVVLDTPTSSDATSSETTPPSEATSPLPTSTSPTASTSPTSTLPTSTSSLPTPSGPSPTPTSSGQSPSSPSTTQPAPPPTPSQVPTQEEETLPPTTAVTPLPTPTATVAATTKPSPTAAEPAPKVPAEEPTTVQGPPTQRQAPVTTTSVLPVPEAGSGGEGS